MCTLVQRPGLHQDPIVGKQNSTILNTEPLQIKLRPSLNCRNMPPKDGELVIDFKQLSLILITGFVIFSEALTQDDFRILMQSIAPGVTSVNLQVCMINLHTNQMVAFNGSLSRFEDGSGAPSYPGVPRFPSVFHWLIRKVDCRA